MDMNDRDLVDAMRVGADEEEALRRRVIDRVMRQAPERNRRFPVPRVGIPQWGWKEWALMVSITACLALVVVYGAPRVYAPSSDLETGTEERMAAKFVSFDFAGDELGTQDQPYQSLERAVASVESGGTLKVKGGSTGESLTIVKRVTLVAVEGPVRIGES